MSEKINLKIQKNEPKRNIGYSGAASIFFALTLLGAVGLIIFNLTLRSQLAGLNAQGAQLAGQFNALGQKRAKYLVEQSQLKQIHSILTTRQALNERLIGLLNALPSQLSFDNISADSTKITLGISSDNLSSLNKVISTTLPAYAKSANSQVQSINLTSFSTGGSTSKNGQYDVSFDILYR